MSSSTKSADGVLHMPGAFPDTSEDTAIQFLPSEEILQLPLPPPATSEEEILQLHSPLPDTCPHISESTAIQYLPPIKKTLELLDLPTEILQSIAKLLPTSAAACFTLCSRQMKHTLGTQYLDALRGVKNKERKDFLFLLERRWPEYFCCRICYKLHSIHYIRRPGNIETSIVKNGIFDLGVHMDDYDLHFLDSWSHLPGYQLNTNHVGLALLRHRCGSKYGIGLDMLQHRSFEIASVPGSEIFTTVEARVFEDELIVRSQHLLLIPETDVSCVKLPVQYLERICPHADKSFIESGGPIEKTREYDMDDDADPFQEQWNFRGDQIQEHHRGICGDADLMRCSRCYTEFQVQVEPPNERISETSLIITAWTNMGGGKRTDTDKWQHFHQKSEGLGWDEFDMEELLESEEEEGEEQEGEEGEKGEDDEKGDEQKGDEQKGGEQEGEEGEEQEDQEQETRGVNFAPGSIRSAFEGQDGSSLETLTDHSRNLLQELKQDFKHLGTLRSPWKKIVHNVHTGPDWDDIRPQAYILETAEMIKWDEARTLEIKRKWKGKFAAKSLIFKDRLQANIDDRYGDRVLTKLEFVEQLAELMRYGGRIGG